MLWQRQGVLCLICHTLLCFMVSLSSYLIVMCIGEKAMDIVKRLRDQGEFWPNGLANEAASVIEQLQQEVIQERNDYIIARLAHEGAVDRLEEKHKQEVGRLKEEVRKWRDLENEAARYVESVICMKATHFTGEEPYVGWKGLGLALSQDYEDARRMREALQKIADYEGGPTDLIWENMAEIARAALQQKESR